MVANGIIPYFEFYFNIWNEDCFEFGLVVGNIFWIVY